MRGLLLKDFYIARNNVLVTAVCLIVIGFGLSFLMESSALLVLAPAVSTTAVFISITSDVSSKWNKNVITMPVSRHQIIGEKYLMYVILAFIGIVIALIPCFVLASVKHDVTLNSLLMYGAIGLAVSFLAGSISLLCAYLFDPEKSQVIFMLAFIGASGIIAIIVLFANLLFPVKKHMILTFGIALTISLVLLGFSYHLAAKIYEKKDIS